METAKQVLQPIPTALNINQLLGMLKDESKHPELVKQGLDPVELSYAFGIKERPKPNIFRFVVKTNDKTNKQYVVIAIDGAKVQFSVGTAEKIIDNLDAFVDCVGLAKDAETEIKGKK